MSSKLIYFSVLYTIFLLSLDAAPVRLTPQRSPSNYERFDEENNVRVYNQYYYPPRYLPGTGYSGYYGGYGYGGYGYGAPYDAFPSDTEADYLEWKMRN